MTKIIRCSEVPGDSVSVRTDSGVFLDVRAELMNITSWDTKSHIGYGRITVCLTTENIQTLILELIAAHPDRQQAKLAEECWHNLGWVG